MSYHEHKNIKEIKKLETRYIGKWVSMSAVSLNASTKSEVLSHSFTTIQITENRTITGGTQGVETNKKFSVELEHMG